MATRRTFLAYTGGTALTLCGYDRFGIRQAYAVGIPGGTLDPGAVNKYVTPLLVPPVMPMAGRIMQTRGKNIDYYEISMKQFQQQILPAGLPATTVWGYGAVASQSKNGLLLHNAPSLTIEAQYDRPVRVKWINDLKDADGNFRPHLLPVDPTLHWANPPGGTAGRDTRSTFTATPGPYTGPVPIVTHLHGAVGVGDESDGYAEAWYLPAAGNIPAGHATQGTWYDFFKAKAADKFGLRWGSGYATFQYPNLGRAAQDWYHDHALGMTRLNVYAGPAGFYILRGGPQGDDAVKDSRTGETAVLPGPAPKANDKFPPNKTYREIPIAIQDRSFNADGSLFYPDSRGFFDGITGPYIPHTDIAPHWNPEFFGNMVMANGNTWPFLTVEARRYRLRFLNGCQSRFLILDFRDVPVVEVWQIGNDGGFLAAPVNLTVTRGNRLLMGPAERADLIVDFTHVPLGSYVLGNVGPDEPFGGGEPGVDSPLPDSSTTAQILQFRVVPSFVADPTTPPQFLTLPALAPLPAATVTRKLALIEEKSKYFEDAPAEALLGTVGAVGALTPLMWMDPVTENPSVGAVEIWELYNTTEDAHPMHVHEVKFQLVDRQPIAIDEAARTVVVNGPVRGPEPGESGFKDTAIAYPGEVTRIRAQFVNPGQYVWHCHIVEHEDNEMMRPYRIGPVQPGSRLRRSNHRQCRHRERSDRCAGGTAAVDHRPGGRLGMQQAATTAPAVENQLWPLRPTGRLQLLNCDRTPHPPADCHMTHLRRLCGQHFHERSDGNGSVAPVRSLRERSVANLTAGRRRRSGWKGQQRHGGHPVAWAAAAARSAARAPASRTVPRPAAPPGRGRSAGAARNAARRGVERDQKGVRGVRHVFIAGEWRCATVAASASGDPALRQGLSVEEGLCRSGESSEVWPVTLDLA